jgi:hypothetical protein
LKDIEAACATLFPAPPEASFTPSGWTPGLVPAFKPFCTPLSRADERLLTHFTASLLWVLFPKWPIAARVNLTWMSQPIDGAGHLAPPRAQPALPPDSHAALTQLPGLAADCAYLCASLADHLPSLPGQNLLDGRQDRAAAWRCAPPPMESAHDAIVLESLPYTSLIRDHFSSLSP